ncbi:RHS repeat-associated core domain-containing protein [Tenacibaculum xiamenense]|uniref:RHS repeat-associated core domain-containing protein n=1 Tax=Tenacibaculum xiamenense TaxID=1261553 RepID=UPI003894F9B1
MKKSLLRLLFFFLLFNVSVSNAQTYTNDKYNNSNYTIPDGNSTSDAGTNVSSVTFSGLPSNAKITKVTIATRVQHGKHSDLAARVSTNWNGISSPSVVIYTAGSQGNNSGALEKSRTTSAFNDLNPNQTFYFRVWDTASGNTGYIDAFGVRVEYTVPPTVNSVSPLSASTNQEVTFTINGNYLTSGMGFHVDNLENIQEQSGGSLTRRYFKGTFQQYSGTKNGVVKDAPNGTTLFNFSVNVSTPHPTVSSVSPLSASTNQEVTFTIDGNNLTSGMGFHVDNLDNIQEQSGGTSTKRYFKGTFQQWEGTKNGVVKDSNGTELYNFTVNVQNSNSPPTNPSINPFPSGTIVYVHEAINVQVRTGTDPDGDQTKVHLTASDSDRTDSNPYISSFGNGNVTHSVPVTFNSTGVKQVYATTFDVHGNASGQATKAVTVVERNATCNFSDVSTTDWFYNAVQDLCARSLIDDDGEAEPLVNINRAELAKLTYLAVGLENNSLADNFHTPIVDLQDSALWYYTYAKNLLYLEFDDGVAPFDKNVNFYPSGVITRAHVLKVLLEAWNIDETDNSGSNPYSDVEVTHEAYNYILKAKDLGIIDSTSTIRPNENALRAEVFVMLYRMLTVNPQTIPDITIDDFFKQGNYTPENLNNFSAIHSGNFNHYTKTSFGIASVGIPLVFSHTYNSYLSDMPKELMYLQPLGKMWTHSFNAYIQEFEADPAFPEYFRVGLTLPNGGFQFYKKQDQNYVPETEGIYDELEKTASNEFTLTTKGQIVYTFLKVNTDSRFYVLKSITDRNNNTLTIDYEDGTQEIDGEKLIRIKEVTGTSGRKLTFSYYVQSDRLKEVTDPLGRKASFLYNGNNYLFAYKNPKDLITLYNYGTGKEKDLLKTITLPKGNVIASDYENKKLKSIETSGADPKKYTYVYDDVKGYIDEIISPTGKITEVDFNEYGNLTNLKDGTTEVEIKYENTDHINYPTEVAYNTQKTSVTYDNKGNVLQRMLPEGVTQTYEYNALNDIERFTDPKGNVYEYGYDSRGNVTSVKTPRATTYFTVNDKGLVTQVTNPENISVGFVYDAYGNVVQTNAPEEITTSATYDIASRLLTSTNPKGNTISYNYDANDNLLSELFGGQTTAYEFDANDNLTKIINAKNKATTLKYNQDDDTLEEMQFGDAVDKYSYDSDGYIKTYTNPKGIVFTYEYFDDKKLKSVNSGSNSVSYTYDSLDRVETVTNENGTLIYTYDDLDRITSVKDYYNKTVEYSYDKNSNVTSITYPDDKQVTYSYYSDNLLKTVTDWNGHSTEYLYRDDGLLTQTLYPNGTKCTFLYDGAGRMVAKTWKKSDDTIINAYSFHLDTMGNHTQEIKTEPFGVIPLNTETQNYSYTDTNRLESVNSTTFDFDDNGNNTVKGDTQYSYDIYDRLIGISKTGYTAEYKYDAYGNRREKTVNGTTQRFVLDILGLSNVLAETDEQGNYQNYYVYGLGLVSRIDASNTTHYYHDDFRGSTIAMTDDSEAITHKYAYDDFGKVTQIEEANFNPYRYVGKYGIQYEDEDLYFMRARYYNPDVGRFLTEDPIWATNLYPYAGNNPVMNVDVNGKFFLPVYIEDYETKRRKTKPSPKKVDTTFEALILYLFGDGEPIALGNNSVHSLMNSSDFKYRHNRIISGKTTSSYGDFSVDLESDVYHIGETNVNYSFICSRKDCIVTYDLFVNDGFWDPDEFVEFIYKITSPYIKIKNLEPDGLGPNLELKVGKPYKYKSVQINVPFSNPGY